MYVSTRKYIYMIHTYVAIGSHLVFTMARVVSARDKQPPMLSQTGTNYCGSNRGPLLVYIYIRESM